MVTKHTSIATAAIASLCVISTPANAGEHANRWSGIHAGAFGAWAKMHSKSIDITGEEFGGSTAGATERTDANGYILGGTLGYRFQHDKWVFGPEFELGYINGNDLKVVNGDDGVLVDYDGIYGSLTGVAGYAITNNTLLFVKGGLAFAKIVNAGGEFDGVGNEDSGGRLGFDGNESGIGDRVRYGFTVGAGVELALSTSWSIKAEYAFAKFKNETYFDPDGENDEPFKFEDELHAVKIGLNYRFTSGHHRVPLK